MSSFTFSTLCECLENISKLKEKSKKAEELSKVLNRYRKFNNSLYSLLRLLLPKLERERGPHGLQHKSLRLLYTRIFCLSKESLTSRSQANCRANEYGEDFADRVYQLIKSQLQNKNSLLPIEEINTFLDNLSSKNASNEKKDSIFLAIAKKMSAFEFKWLTRIILKDLRLGIGQNSILKAIHPNAEELFNLTSDLRELCNKLQNVDKIEKPGIKMFYHIKPMLLERCRIEDIGKLFEDKSMKYILQVKYDGERSQIHIKDGRFKYFTRNSYDITNNALYGESITSDGFLTKNICRLIKNNCKSLILDGEIMGWHKTKKVFGSKGMSFDVKKLTSNSALQPCFVAYDLIMHNDELLLNLPYNKRWEKLQNSFQDEEGIMIKAKSTIVCESAQVVDFFNKSLDENEEGIVLKKYNSLYKPNCREGSECYKIKAEFSDDLIQDTDLIILGGYYGNGRDAGLLRSFLMGIQTTGNQSKKFQSVVSVSSGLSKEQLLALQKKFELKGQKNCPDSIVGPKNNLPDIWIKPEESVILQVRASEIIRSNFYPIGYTLRFPRVESVRHDKPWHDACSYTEFCSYIKDTGVVQKLTKRHATIPDTENIKPKKIPKSYTLKSFTTKKVEENSLGVHSSDVVRISRCLKGKEICVLNGDEELSKNDIEKLLISHAAKIVQNPGAKTYCVIVGNAEKVKVKNAMMDKNQDFVGINWLKRITDIKNWPLKQDFYPWELLASRSSTTNRLLNNFDKFQDSYIEDVDESTLSRILNQISIITEEFSTEDFKKVEETLFSSPSPFSIFRGFVGFFHNPEDKQKYSFRFLSGNVEINVNEHVTHIFLEENNQSIIQNYHAQFPNIVMIKSKYIEDCFKKRELLACDDYIIKTN